MPTYEFRQEIGKIHSVNGKEYRILKLLGKGKGGYSYLAESNQGKVVLKQIHHEPCDYYQFMSVTNIWKNGTLRIGA